MPTAGPTPQPSPAPASFAACAPAAVAEISAAGRPLLASCGPPFQLCVLQSPASGLQRSVAVLGSAGRPTVTAVVAGVPGSLASAQWQPECCQLVPLAEL